MRVIVMADDLTGGNALAALLRREGLPCWTHLLGEPACGGVLPDTRAAGAHVLALDTRNVSGAEAARRLEAAAAALGAVPDLIGLRIDSTLRGPIAASLDAMLAQQWRLALVVPAFPASGRTTRGGIHYVKGTPVAQTEIAHDPESPVISSCLADWIGGRTRLPYANLPLADVRRGRARVADRLAAAFAGSARVIFCDAETDADIEQIARGALDLRRACPELSLLPVDPGPFTAALVRVLREPSALAPLVFGVMCSLMQTASRQMDFVESGGYATTFRYDGQSAPELLAAFRGLPPSTRTILVRTDTACIDVHSRLRLHAVLAALFPGVIAAFPSLRGLFLSGGETAARLLASLGVRTLALRGEVGPLATLSRVCDGALRGMVLATKGGSVGRTSAIADLLGHLYDALADDDRAGVALPSSPASGPPAPPLPPELPGEILSSSQKVAAI
jgi:uncharacterized protein YgbK (DUF1537 family)